MMVQSQRNMRWCPEMIQFQSVTSEVINSKLKTVRPQSSSQQNLYHYFFYNRLMDYWNNLRIVKTQYTKLYAKLREGEVIIRDPLFRFVYACSSCRVSGHNSMSCPNK